MTGIFETLNELADVQALIADGIRETEVLEYKASDRKFGDKEKDEIGKDVSAMANSLGGVIVYGVATDRTDRTLPVGLTGLEPANIETIDRVLNSRVRPPIKVDKKLIPAANPQVMVIGVPSSDESPHQDLSSKKYYHRSGTESLAMEHDLVALHFGRRIGPVLSLSCKLTAPTSAPLVIADNLLDSTLFRLDVMVTNTGKRSAKYLQVILSFDGSESNLEVELKERNWKDISRLRPGRRTFQFNNNIGVVHPGVSSIGEFGIRLTKAFYAAHASDIFAMWSVVADDTPYRDGSFSLRELGLTVEGFPAT